ncbi:hypothetical protein Tco_0955030 [Tanacetum coccineum]|uniref:Uncharacterized protein n=1 Tax=Tanacetum coccineum TaxID=301880 RepID=A0ABQ5E631_9ASTR
MSSSTHPITILSDSNVEDAFSSTNTPDYTPASPDYFPTSQGNNPSDSSDYLTKYLLASLAISPFHDDPYMKVMQAYNTTNNESPILLPQAPIAPPTIFPPSLVLPLSPMFDPQDFFLPKEILPPQKRAHFLSSSSTDFFAPPYVFEIEEKTELQEARTQIYGFQREQIRHDDEIFLARVRTSTLEILIEDIQIRHRSDMKSLLDKIHELKNHMGRPPDY